MYSKDKIFLISLIVCCGYFSCQKTSTPEIGDNIDGTTVSTDDKDEEDAAVTQDVFISNLNNNIQYEGRVEDTPIEGTHLYWPGTTVRLRFYGTRIEAYLQDFSTNNSNYFYVIIDSSIKKKIKLDNIRRYYTLADNLDKGEHLVELVKLNHMNIGYNRSYVALFGFKLDAEGRILSPPDLKRRKIEFYGNSITCGRSNEDTTNTDSPASEFENNYLAYGAITSRHFDAQYHCIAYSGMGLTVGYTNIIMPELYDRTAPSENESKWNFESWIPDIVVINLLQNDASILNTPSNNLGEFQKRWGGVQPTDQQLISKYKGFIGDIRNKYPQANIICTLGSMNAVIFSNNRYANIIKDAVEGLNDNKVYVHLFPYKNTPRHPTVAEHIDMANSLIAFIEDNIKW